MTLPHGPRPTDWHSPRLFRCVAGEVLRRIRLAQGRTLAEVARAARVSMQYLSELERGRKEASSEILAAICAALRIELSDLLAEVWRDLMADQARRVSAIGVTVTQVARSAPASRGVGDVVCLAA
ncbi:MAG TPA: helix-turn-helix transcriptional regulator [Stackebrandtia sp.]|jgi:transcriptional regulator with XRE-family HTH domain|uniref:helix-turn-helix domain-containing protein n=1 Tax=Stackebrandtia sp. TaxID=2023065 RepID=UPI002D2C9C05|nr:helix-turn-helix transcriptional regulator [Stackebrandtia sp.]HZE38688.1 helix-turn-helix transcriptional regulator [Stackebrandtia sp.]